VHSSLRVFRLQFVCISHLSYSWHMPRPSHPPWFDRLNTVGVKITKFLMQCSSWILVQKSQRKGKERKRKETRHPLAIDRSSTECSVGQKLHTARFLKLWFVGTFTCHIYKHQLSSGWQDNTGGLSAQSNFLHRCVAMFWIVFRLKFKNDSHWAVGLTAVQLCSALLRHLNGSWCCF
jgi:hypothetical protein